MAKLNPFPHWCGIVSDKAMIMGDDGVEEILPHGTPQIKGLENIVCVVRCKDCKHRYTFSSGHSICKEHFLFPAKDDDFCSYGERREEE